MAVSVGDEKALEFVKQENFFVDQLKARHPSDPKVLRLWAISRGQLSDVQNWQCDAFYAIDAASKSARVAAGLIARGTGDDVLRDRLTTDLTNIGDAMRAQGDTDGADHAYKNALEHVNSQLSREPYDRTLLSDRAHIEERIGDMASLRQNPEIAETHYKAFFKAAKQLVGQDPEAGNFVSALSLGHERLVI